ASINLFRSKLPISPGVFITVKAFKLHIFNQGFYCLPVSTYQKEKIIPIHCKKQLLVRVINVIIIVSNRIAKFFFGKMLKMDCFATQRKFLFDRQLMNAQKFETPVNLFFGQYIECSLYRKIELI